MIAKTFEVRDEGTFIPVLAVKLLPACEADRFLLARAGYGLEPEVQGTYVLMCQVNGGDGRCSSDVFKWDPNSRTMHRAHQHIKAHFDELESGAVVDVQFLLGETPAPKQADRLVYPV